MSVTGRDIRIADGAYTGDPDAPVGPPVLDAWVASASPRRPGRARGAARPVHRASPDRRRPPAPRRHRPGPGPPHVSTAINAISISFHADPGRPWMLYHHLSTFAGDGMTHAECRVHDEAGALLASFTVDAMVRAFAARRADDDQTAL